MEVVLMHLQSDKKSGILSYRRRFPTDLIPHIPCKSPTGRGRTELKVSLGARDMRDGGATERYNQADRDWEQIVERARKRAGGIFDQLDAETIAYLASYFVNEGLEIAELVGLADCCVAFPLGPYGHAMRPTRGRRTPYRS